MVSANLARGVPEFWAPWVMPVAPPVEVGSAVYMFRGDGALIALDRTDDPKKAWLFRPRLGSWLILPGKTPPGELHRGFVALGPDGPTLAPWSKS
jgi:hypothetical protein